MVRRGSKPSSGERGGKAGGNVPASKKAMFNRLMRKATATMNNIREAERFLEGMETFQSKAELLARLTDNRECGTARIRDVLSFINSVRDVELLLMRLLDNVMNDETNRPMFRPLRDKVLLVIYGVPMLMETLVDHNITEAIKEKHACKLCSFLRAVAKAYLEPRKSEQVKKLAKGLQDRGDVEDAGILSSLVLIDDKTSSDTSLQVKPKKLEPAVAACWKNDMNPPGGRHNNDDRNFRNINVIPTVDELCCAIDPYLPLASGENNFIQDPVTRLLDKNFRLIREDAVASMREKIKESMCGLWGNARIIELEFFSGAGSWEVTFVVRFDRKKGKKVDWNRSRALMPGSIIALCQDGKPIRMGVISIREEKWLTALDGPKIGIAFQNVDDLNISIEEMVHNQHVGEDAHECVSTNENANEAQFISYDLEEVSKSFFAYQPILEALQAMESAPFSGVLCGANDEEPTLLRYLPDEVQLPPEKEFNNYKVCLVSMDVGDVTSKTTLDTSQAKALHHVFTESVALIQGPPGCGKTFIGALLARIIRQNTDESIVCVCYTNHALDQFLEHMLDSGETRLVRIGGRSKSERLSTYQLKILAQKKSEQKDFTRRRFGQVTAQLKSAKTDIDNLKKTLAESITWKSHKGGIKAHLLNDYPDTFSFLQTPKAKGGFKIVGPGGKKVNDDFLWNCWRRGEDFPSSVAMYMDDTELSTDAFKNFWSTKLSDRQAMIAQWKQEINEPIMAELSKIVKEVQALVCERQTLRQESDLNVLKHARIIGATTSGAAKYREILKEKAAGVVIVEEAGEVLEGHILSALTPETKHLIMIGDHKQLRPKVETYELTTTSGYGYNLDCSLFERLILEGRPSVALEVQHRMRPSISALIRNQTYPNLKDHESVSRLPNLKGVSENLVFIDHRYIEDRSDQEGTTRSNKKEAEIVVEIVRFFLLQGYRTDQLVVLTPYLGQLFTLLDLIQRNLKEVTALVDDRDVRDLEELDIRNLPLHDSNVGTNDKRVRVSSVDNFQGEEADVVIISMVRSNKDGKIGFLKEEQRVNVLLSRARHGMIIVGNSETLKASSKKGRETWNPILDQLESGGLIMKGLPTVCQLHPEDSPIILCKPKQFREVRPNGGCDRPCTYRLSCGHACPMMCHPIDRDHRKAQLQCTEPCPRFPPQCFRKHPCPRRCNVDCGPCRAKVPKVTLECGHILKNSTCHESSSEKQLKQLSKRCKVIVSHTFSGCGHIVDISCGKSKQGKMSCPATCGKLLVCGHPCLNICESCTTGAHQCEQTCERMLFCGHTCGRPCHEPNGCDPCNKKCETRCTHSACPLVCCNPCHSCVQACDWECEHQGKCKLVCGAPCSRLPCNKRCEKMLKCKHQCPSVCGETCPDQKFCRECASEQTKSQIVDILESSEYRNHDVEKDPIIVLPCGHFFAISTLDNHLELEKVYTMIGDQFIGLEPLKRNGVGEKPKVCMKCRAPIHSIRRYGRFLRLTELRSLERKHMMQVNGMLKQVSQDESIENTGIMESVERVETLIRKSPMRKVFEACGGSDDVEAPSPPAAPLMECLSLKGKSWGSLATASGDDAFKRAEAAYDEAIQVANASASIRSGGMLRLALAKLHVKCHSHKDANAKKISDVINPLLDWIIDHCHNFSDLVEDATTLKSKMEETISTEELQQVVAAMNEIKGYNYGGSASSHWYECPNGHPYSIGECGGAMETAVCYECVEQVGGRSHTLLDSNRRAEGRIMDAFNRT